MKVNTFFRKGLAQAIKSLKRKEELRTLILLEWSSNYALFQCEYVDKDGNYKIRDIRVDSKGE